MKRLCLMVLFVCIAAFAGFGCGDDGNSGGSGSSSVDDAGNNSPDGGEGNLEIPTANSGAFASTTWEDPDASGTFYLSVVAISDHQDICSTVRDTCDGQNSDEEGTVLAFQLLGGQEQRTGRYTVDDFDEESFTTDTMVASAQVDGLSDTAAEFDASSGHVEVTTFTDQRIAGTYELTFEGQAHTGSFDVDFCQKLEDDLNCG